MNPFLKKLTRHCPEWLLAGGRYVLRQTERNKVARERLIRRAQDEEISRQYEGSGARVIVYLVDGADWVTGREKLSGGLLSIASMYEETRKLPMLDGCQVIMATLDSTHLILRHVEFENNITVFRLSQIFTFFPRVRELTIHVPELLIPAFAAQLRRLPAGRLASIKRFQINILNQNILKMPGPEEVEPLKRMASEVTMTTAATRYCTPEMAEKYGVSVHNLSVFSSPEQYKRRAYEEKANLMIVSPDEEPAKAAILARLRERLPSLQIQIIRNLTYMAYKATIEKAKWGVTFGEGMDLYFIETVFSGGISFAVYNDDFFPVEFKSVPTVFPSYEAMLDGLPAMIEELDNPAVFAKRHAALYSLCRKHYQYDQYLRNLVNFYEGNYQFPHRRPQLAGQPV